MIIVENIRLLIVVFKLFSESNGYAVLKLEVANSHKSPSPAKQNY